jgi:hypothetical protein
MHKLTKLPVVVLRTSRFFPEEDEGISNLITISLNARWHLGNPEPWLFEETDAFDSSKRTKMLEAPLRTMLRQGGGARCLAGAGMG